jgi:hypothetical protein
MRSRTAAAARERDRAGQRRWLRLSAACGGRIISAMFNARAPRAMPCARGRERLRRTPSAFTDRLLRAARWAYADELVDAPFCAVVNVVQDSLSAAL